MTSFSIFKKQRLLSLADEELIVQAIRIAEKHTSGEIRVYVESKCRFVDPVDRAMEVFFGLKMDKTDDHNGVIIYIALKDHQLAIYGDEGINKKVGKDFWSNEIKKMLHQFNGHNYIKGICEIINDIGQTLQKEYPYLKDDKNELPDEIVFGK